MIDITLNDLAPLPEDLKRIKQEGKEERKNALQRLRNAHKERLVLAKKLRKAAETLIKSGFRIQRPSYVSCLPYEFFYLDLGEASDEASRQRIERDKLAIAKLFKCHLDEDYKELVDGKKKKVKISLCVSKLPNIHIQYTDILQDGGKCQIVKEVTKTKRKTDYRLVCNI